MPGYVWDGSQWRTINGIYAWDDTVATPVWRSIRNAYAWDDTVATPVWRNIFSSGTFAPTLRNPTGGAIFNNRSVGLAIELYRGSNVSGSYAYKFQYSFLDQVSWTNENNTPNNAGTLTGTTTTTSFSTDISYLSALENAAYSGNVGGEISDVDTYRRQDGKFIFLRARVIKSGETQFSNTVRIQKRRPVDTGTYLQLTRASTGTNFNLSTTNRSPRPGDTLRWITSFQNTTTFTNDTRPDYYWISFDGGVGTLERNSVITDVANPRNPVNTGSYTVQAGDVGAQIVSNLRAINSNTDTTDLSFATLEVSDGALQAPQNLNLSLLGGNLQGSWDASLGGNDNAITYVYSLEKDGVVIFTSTSQSATIFSRAASGNGNYRFRVTASQTGSVSIISGYSNVYILVPPAAFNVTVQNVTNTVQYLPSAFTINAPTISATVLNRWDWTWTVSTITGPAYAKTGSFNVTSVNSWTSVLTRPNGTQAGPTTVGTPTDFWGINSSGNHTETVTARNNRKNFVRISWTRPAGTSAVSYRVTVNAYSAATNGSLDWNRTINVEDINFVDIEHDYSANGAYSNGQAVLVTSVTGYDGAGQTGSSVAGTLPQFNEFGADGTTSWSGCNVISSASTGRTDNLSLEVPSTGQLTTTGIFEPGNTLSLVQGGGVWYPSYANWTKTAYSWIRSRTVQPVETSTTSTTVVATTATAVGSEYFCGVTMNYKGTTETVYSSVADIVPGPPSYSLTDLLNQTFRISGVISNGGTSFYGTYTGVSSGTIPETTQTGGTFTSPTVNVGSISTEVFSRRYVTQVYPNTVSGIQINGTRSNISTISIATPPQSTGSRRFLFVAPSVGAGSTMYISTNGFFGNAAPAANNYLRSTLPTPGGFLNIAAEDLVMVSCFTRVDSGGTWIRYRGYRYNTPGGPFLEYQAYLTFSGEAYVLFIENGLTDYRTDLAYFQSGTQQNTWSANSTIDNTNLTINQGTSGWTSRAVSTGSNDDGIVSFVVTAPARQHQASAVTRTAGGFTFNITNVADSTFESAATYTVSINLPSPAAASINTSTGLVTATGLTSSQFATVTVSKARFGFDSPTNVVVQGQALAGAAPVQTVAISTSASLGISDSSGTLRRVQSGGQISGTAGTYNNQQSISSGWLTLLSSSYTGADSNWTSLSVFTTSNVSVNDSSASQSANMYRWRDRVVGTDGSTVDFYSAIVYRAVYAQPSGVSENTGSRTQTQIVLNYTGYGAQRIYRFRDGSQVDFFAPPASGSAVTTFSGLTAGNSYSLLLYGGNNEGYLSVNASGGTYSTSPATSFLATPSPSASTNRTDGILISWGAIPNASTYGVWYRGGAPSYNSSPDFPTTSGLSYLDTSAPVGTRQYDVQAYPASGSTSFVKSQWGGPATGTRNAVVVLTPAITSGPGISWSGGNNFNLSATADNATNLEFEVQFANANGGPVLRTQTFFFAASQNGGQTGAQANSWARTRVRANNSGSGLSSSFTGYSGWA
jgi:hypothetical protein